MTRNASYPFYRSIRFRFGLLFNCLLFLFLLIIILLLYGNVKTELKKNYILRLSNGITAVLQKTEINPLTIPLPQNNEHFSISYNNTKHSDTLFNNLPVNDLNKTGDSVYANNGWWGIERKKILETGGVIRVVYALPAKEYNNALKQLQVMLWIYVPAAILISFGAGYYLSGIFLKPLKSIINKANQTDLTNEIKLLDVPVVKDELHELVDALNRMLSRIEKQSQEQNAFFASASHELRTPLSVMLAELQTTNIKESPAAAESLIKNQLSEVQRLKELVNNFLLMSQLKAESIAVNKSAFNIAELCIEKMEALKNQTSENDQAFKIILRPNDADFTVFADKGQIAVVLNNLLTNAIKYAPRYSSIHVSVTKKDQQLVVVIQNESGLLIENISQLKEQFKRADFYKEGFGLGLWITDKLMLLNNGELILSHTGNDFNATIFIESL